MLGLVRLDIAADNDRPVCENVTIGWTRQIIQLAAKASCISAMSMTRLGRYKTKYSALKDFEHQHSGEHTVQSPTFRRTMRGWSCGARR